MRPPGANNDIWAYGTGNSGSDNYCDLTNGYSDTGFTGCAHSCSATTSSTTTTTSSSTTTTQIHCTLPSDFTPCAEISLQEVIEEINEWATGNATLEEVIDIINLWAHG